jgi:hypothetical protein
MRRSNRGREALGLPLQEQLVDGMVAAFGQARGEALGREGRPRGEYGFAASNKVATGGFASARIAAGQTVILKE